MTDGPADATVNTEPAPPAVATRRPAVLLAVVYALLLLLGAAAVFGGIELRRNLYTGTEAIRFRGDINNGWHWGRRALRDGVVETYDRLDREQAGNARPDYGLDYPPVRLWIVSRWAALNAERYPGVDNWRPDYDFSRPMLLANNTAELLSAALVFLIVRRQVLQTFAATGPYRPRERGEAAVVGFVGAILLWFNPGVLFDAHVFPQWDMWIVPFFLGAVLAGMSGRFFVGGLLIGCGVLVKGQLLWAAPVLLLWPATAMNWRGVVDFIAGAATGVAALTWPWLVRGAAGYAIVLLCGAAATAAVVYWKKWRTIPLVFGATGLAAIFVAGPLCGSLAWWKVGYVYGSTKYPVLYTVGVSNLCTILKERFGFGSPLDGIDLPVVGPVVLKTLLATAFAAAALVCAAGAAFHLRRRDPRFLAAVSAPFVIFYTLMPQMHDRYLVWGAATTSLLVCVGVGMTLVHLGITAIMWLAITRNLCQGNPDWWPALTRFVEAVHVDIGWALIVLAIVLLYQAGPWPGGGRRVRERVL